jgi:hypothetical protein
MNYKPIEHLKDSDFKRLTGVQRETFEQMLTVIEKGLRDFGRPPKLSRSAADDLDVLARISKGGSHCM